MKKFWIDLVIVIGLSAATFILVACLVYVFSDSIGIDVKKETPPRPVYFVSYMWQTNGGSFFANSVMITMGPTNRSVADDFSSSYDTIRSMTQPATNASIISFTPIIPRQ
jgi:hypothetical protein